GGGGVEGSGRIPARPRRAVARRAEAAALALAGRGLAGVSRGRSAAARGGASSAAAARRGACLLTAIGRAGRAGGGDRRPIERVGQEPEIGQRAQAGTHAR